MFKFQIKQESKTGKCCLMGWWICLASNPYLPLLWLNKAKLQQRQNGWQINLKRSDGKWMTYLAIVVVDIENASTSTPLNECVPWPFFSEGSALLGWEQPRKKGLAQTVCCSSAASTIAQNGSKSRAFYGCSTSNHRMLKFSFSKNEDCRSAS